MLCHCIVVKENFKKNNDDFRIVFFFSQIFGMIFCWTILGRQDVKLLNFCEIFDFSSKMLAYINFV